MSALWRWQLRARSTASLRSSLGLSYPTFLFLLPYPRTNSSPPVLSPPLCIPTNTLPMIDYQNFLGKPSLARFWGRCTRFFFLKAWSERPLLHNYRRDIWWMYYTSRKDKHKPLRCQRSGDPGLFLRSARHMRTRRKEAFTKKTIRYLWEDKTINQRETWVPNPGSESDICV